MQNNIAVIILAAGMGTRMKSNKAKVLHEIAGRPMIVYVAEAARKVAGDDVIVVIGNQAQRVRGCLSECGELIFAHQDNQPIVGHICYERWDQATDGFQRDIPGSLDVEQVEVGL